MDHFETEQVLKILFVDDSEDDVELTVRELERCGLKLVFARVDTEPGMQEALRTGDWDLVISDYRMPNFSASRSLDCLLECAPTLPFIILSGAVEAEEVVTLLKRGAHDFINKSNMARLVPAIEREVRESEQRRQRQIAEERVRILSSTVEQSPVSVVISDRTGTIEYVNPKFEEVTGYTCDEAIGKDINFTLLKNKNAGSLEEFCLALQHGEGWRGEFCNSRKDGQFFWEFANISPLRDEQGEVSHFIAVKEDITVRRSYEEQLVRKAHYDDLTGLANRTLLIDRLEKTIDSALRNGAKGALLCLDLDHFKNINDTMGHAVGDELLREAVNRLAACVRKADTLARMGGDEFVIVSPDVADEGTFHVVAERILSEFEKPFNIGGKDHFVTSSIGITIFPDDGQDHQVLLRNADLAMYRAKELGRNRFHFFTEEINQKLTAKIELESKLRTIVERDELLLHYQPIIDVKTGVPVAMEALVRWKPEGAALCMPGQFIPQAESVGLIEDIGNWVLQKACSDLASLHKTSLLRPKVAVNVSPKQLQNSGFTDFVSSVLQNNKLPSHTLELELTESVIVEDDPETIKNIKQLSALGVSLSIDDFGTGYSSLSYLQKYPFNVLKVDRSFVKDMLANENSAKLVETIIKMAKNLDLKVVAEGVETEEQLAFLSRACLSCEYVQGYLLGRPVEYEGIVSEICEHKLASSQCVQRLTD